MPGCRGGPGDETWKNNSESMLREMISQNHNHARVENFWQVLLFDNLVLKNLIKANGKCFCNLKGDFQ